MVKCIDAGTCEARGYCTHAREHEPIVVGVLKRECDTEPFYCKFVGSYTRCENVNRVRDFILTV